MDVYVARFQIFCLFSLTLRDAEIWSRISGFGRFSSETPHTWCFVGSPGEVLAREIRRLKWCIHNASED